jgi:hypothetical protein
MLGSSVVVSFGVPHLLKIVLSKLRWASIGFEELGKTQMCVARTGASLEQQVVAVICCLLKC